MEDATERIPWRRSFANVSLEGWFQEQSFARTFWPQLMTALVVLTLRVVYLVSIFERNSSYPSLIAISFVQLLNLCIIIAILLCLRQQRRKPWQDESSGSETNSVEQGWQHSAPVSSANANPDALHPGSFYARFVTPFYAHYVTRGYFGYHWCLTLLLEQALVIGTDWAFCTSGRFDEVGVCVSYSNGLFPLPPTFSTILIAFAIAVLATHMVESMVSISICYLAIYLQVGFLYVFDAAEPSYRILDVIRNAVLYASGFFLCLAFAYFTQEAYRQGFGVLWSLHLQHDKEKEQIRREKQAVAELNMTREREIAARTARGVQELTIGYVGHQAANIVHQLQFACQNLTHRTDLPLACLDDIADLDDALQRLKRILNDVLSHQRLLSGRVELALKPVQVRTALQAFTTSLLAVQHCEVELAVDSDVPTIVECDWFRVEQVLVNACTNAMHAVQASADVTRVPAPIRLRCSLMLAPPLSSDRGESVITDSVITTPTWLYACEQRTSITKSARAGRSASSSDGRRTGRTSSSSGELPVVHPTARPAPPSPPAGATAGGGLGEAPVVAARVQDVAVSIAAPKTSDAAGALHTNGAQVPAATSTTSTTSSTDSSWVWCLHFQVSNMGVGLQEHDPLTLFAPFDPEAGISSPRKRLQKAGLGLPINRLLAGMMRARIGLFDEPTSTPGEWKTTFMLQLSLMPHAVAPGTAGSTGATPPTSVGSSLQVAQAESAAAIARGISPLDLPTGSKSHAQVRFASIAARSAAFQTGSSGSSSSTPIGGRILIVDDVKANRKVNARIVTKLGWTAEQASDGDEVLDKVQEAAASGQPFDAIMLDIVMQRKHGDEACSELRRLGYRMPIIAATGNASELDRLRYAQAGFNAVLSKPFSVDQVRDTLEAVGFRRGTSVDA